jgi:predicted nucleotidyltransferase
MSDAQLIGKLMQATCVLAGTGIVAAYAFGSRVYGRPRPDSDLDVGYFLSRNAGTAPLSLREEMRLTDVLSQAVGVEVDLRDLGDAPLELRGRAIVEGVRVFSGDAVERVGLERDLLARYFDYQEEFRQLHELRLKSMAERKTP